MLTLGLCTCMKWLCAKRRSNHTAVDTCGGISYGEELRSLFKLMESETVKPPVCENLGALCADTVAKMHARLLESSVRGKLTASVAQ